MDDFGKDFTLSTTIKPNSPSQGTDVKKLSEEMDFKLKMAHKKRLEIKHFMSTKASTSSKDPVSKKKKRNKTLDVEEGQHCLSRSVSFDSMDSRLAVNGGDDIKNPYDPKKNYLSPRPKFLRYNPDRHHEISARQESVSRVRRSASCDSRMRYPEEELESIVDASSVEETDIIKINSVDFKDEDEHGFKEEIDDFEVKRGWNLNVFLQYLLVTVLLILTTFAIYSMNSPNLSPAKEPIRCFMDLVDKNNLVVKIDDVAQIQHEQTTDVDVNNDEIWSKNESDVEETEEQEIISDQFHEPVNVLHATEAAEKEIYNQLLTDDSDQVEISEDSETLKTEEVVREEDGNVNNSNLDERFDPVFTAFIAIFVLIPAALSAVYYSKKSRISTPITHQISTNIKNLEYFLNSSTLTRPDEASSSQTTSSYMEPSIDSPSYGSFTVEKIVKKKKSKNAEVMLSPVRRSSRIHNRSVTSPLTTVVSF